MLITGLVFTLVRGQLRTAEASQAAVSITDRIELNELDRAGDFIKTLEKADPGLLGYPPMIEARQRFDAAQVKESDRQLRFDEALREAGRAPLTTPEPKVLEIPRSLARGETEKQSIDRLVEQRRAALQAERNRQETALRPRLEGVSQGLREIDRQMESPAVDEAPVNESISSLQRTLADLGPEFPLAGDDLQGLARDLGQKLEGARTRLGRLRRQTRILEEITAAVSYSPAGSGDAAARLAQARPGLRRG